MFCYVTHSHGSLNLNVKELKIFNSTFGTEDSETPRGDFEDAKYGFTVTISGCVLTCPSCPKGCDARAIADSGPQQYNNSSPGPIRDRMGSGKVCMYTRWANICVPIHL